ncbi:MAG: HD domain-containing protein, partial [Myxococcales bacterium]|nr:HD domain-containing protein [Myxococcales bacterium]
MGSSDLSLTRASLAADEPGLEGLFAPLEQAARSGVLPDPAQTAQVAARVVEVARRPPSELYALLTPPLCGPHPHIVLQWLCDCGLLSALLPELDATVDFSQEVGRRHKDVWEHTKAVVMQAVPRPEVRWAAVLHDIGKVPTRRFVGGKVTFHGHAEEGAAMFRRGPARRIGFPPVVRERVEALILHHLRAGQYDGSWTDAAVRRFAREMGPLLRDLLDLSRADVTSKRPGQRRRCLRRISELAARIRELRERDARVPPLPSGLGDALMHALGLPPGRHIGELRGRLAALCDAGELAAGEDVAFYVEEVRR